MHACVLKKSSFSNADSFLFYANQFGCQPKPHFPYSFLITVFHVFIIHLILKPMTRIIKGTHTWPRNSAFDEWKIIFLRPIQYSSFHLGRSLFLPRPFSDWQKASMFGHALIHCFGGFMHNCTCTFSIFQNVNKNDNLKHETLFY